MLADGLPDRLALRLASGRAAAEARMGAGNGASTVAVMRKTGLTAQSEDSGLEVPVWATVHVDLPFRLDTGGGGLATAGGSSSETVGGVEYELAVAVGNFPASTLDLADGDLVVITAGAWIDTVWRIVKATTADQKTARRVPIESARPPLEWAA